VHLRGSPRRAVIRLSSFKLPPGGKAPELESIISHIQLPYFRQFLIICLDAQSRSQCSFAFAKGAVPVVQASATVLQTTSLEEKMSASPTTISKPNLAVLWGALA
jgi:hypothetical protein